MTNGKELNVFYEQIKFQEEITGNTKALPRDDVYWFTYHMNAMVEELGEVLKVDKRWKTHRKDYFNPEEKGKELVDVYITALNLAIFSGLEPAQFLEMVKEKQKQNAERLNAERSK